jgi:prepilin-type N-terminal cleavage/methylation domain-containing protein
MNKKLQKSNAVREAKRSSLRTESPFAGRSPGSDSTQHAVRAAKRSPDIRGSTRYADGFTLIEVIIAMAISLIVVLVVGILLISGQRGWARTYSFANSKSQLNALTTTISFGTYGRKSNRTDYKLYEVNGEHFARVFPENNPEEVLTGQAVEFHYWDTPLDSAIMNTSITGTAYALFYLEENRLMLDTGPLPPGGVDGGGNRFDGLGVTTIMLANNVTELEFSHTSRDMAGDGKGCVRMKLTMSDPNDNTQTTVTAATLMRNVWP